MQKVLNLRLIFVLFNVALLAALIFPYRADAQWPPFRFLVEPSYEDGKITYQVDFRSRADWDFWDVDIKIPLPEGTRFLESNAQNSTAVSFDGQEVTFFTSVLARDQIRVASFTVEVIDPEKSEFTTQPWIAWKGEVPGDYLFDEVSIDITEEPLDWSTPRSTRLQLEMDGIITTYDTVTYNIYVENLSGGRGYRLWDLKINVPLPEGTTLISTQALSPFVSNFDGQEVSFLLTELPAYKEVPPLSFTVSTEGVTKWPLVTHAWASWKNWSRNTVRRDRPWDETLTGDVVVYPLVGQRVLADKISDTPFSNYDLTSISLTDKGDAFKTTFHTAGHICSVDDEDLVFVLFIDSDCSSGTGAFRRRRGIEYEVRYRVGQRGAAIRAWSDEDREWSTVGTTPVDDPTGGKFVTMTTPYELIGDDSQFCWLGQTVNRLSKFSSNPPNDWLPDSFDSRLNRYDPTVIMVESTEVMNGVSEEVDFISQNQDISGSEICAALKNVELSPLADPNPIQGKLAFPVDGGDVTYDVYIVSMPDGMEIARIENARQPDFRPDGQRLLINREGDGIENVYEYDLETGVQTQVSDAPDDSHPVYNPWGNRIVYDNPKLTVGSRGQFLREESRLVGTEERDRNKKKSVYTDPRRSFIFVQCGLIPPYKESEPRCQDMASLGKLVPAFQMGEIVGDQPVWTDDDRIAYRGCNTWASSRLCGIYIVPASSTRGFSDGVNPVQLTDHPSDTPADTEGDLITFTSYRDGNWEAYLMKTDGTGLRNLSSHAANDGLPTISPDGYWVAFVSDRSGQWAVWVTSVFGGEPQKLFDLPATVPWGDGDRAWQTERISWGP